MRRDVALALLGAHMEELARFGVQSLALFGSVARDVALPDSDVDLLVEFNWPVGLFSFVEVKEYLEQVLGCRVDLVTRAGLKRQLRDRILQEAVGVGQDVAAPRCRHPRSAHANPSLYDRAHLESFKTDDLLVDVVVRNFIVVGEASAFRHRGNCGARGQLGDNVLVSHLAYGAS